MLVLRKVKRKARNALGRGRTWGILHNTFADNYLSNRDLFKLFGNAFYFFDNAGLDSLL